MPIDTVRDGLPIQLKRAGWKFACGSLRSGASMKPRVMNPQAVPSCGPTLSTKVAALMPPAPGICETTTVWMTRDVFADDGRKRHRIGTDRTGTDARADIDRDGLAA